MHTLLKTILLLTVTTTSFSQNDVVLYNTWTTSGGELTVSFYDRYDDDVDEGTYKVYKVYPNGSYCKCKIVMTFPFDWITKDGKVMMYYNLNSSYLTIDHECSGGDPDNYQLYKDGCTDVANSTFANWKATFNPSVERTYSISGNVLSFDGNHFYATKPVNQAQKTEDIQIEEKQEYVEVEKEEEIITPAQTRNGFQTYTWPDGTTYSGNWKDNLRHGTGKVTWTDGTSYEGEWMNDHMHGKGTYTWADKSTYVGDFNNDRMEGKGTYTSTTGETYTGDWLANKRHGTGTVKWPDGSTYIGEWKNNNLNGQGVYISADGAKEEGEFVNGVFMGG